MLARPDKVTNDCANTEVVAEITASATRVFVLYFIKSLKLKEIFL